MIDELNVSGYRSIRDLSLRLGRLNVLVGSNGCGKTNLYRAMYLIHAASYGRLARTLLEEGGMPSALWAGKRGRGPVRMCLGFMSGSISYELELGLPMPGSGFDLDPQVKGENIGFTEGRGKPVVLLERGISSVWARDADGRRVTYPMSLDDAESVFAQLREPHRFPHLSALRQEVQGWRFYHGFRSDLDSVIRQPQVGIRTPVLSDDGRDLGAALATIFHIGDGPGLHKALDRAFPGARLSLSTSDHRFEVGLQMPDFHRSFTAQELSDGTLRYLCLLAALFSPRPPALLALNEPETSIHPDLMEPLAELIVRASRDSQLWVTTHSEALAAHIQRLAGAEPIRLEKVDGETRAVGRGLLG
jgi:predicted ATPase